MTNVTQTELLPGVRLTAVHTTKFKSSLLGVHLMAPLRSETAALNALVPMVLRRGTEQHPDMEQLSAALDELYGGTIEPTVRKKGETQCVGFVGGFLDDAYTPDGSSILPAAAALLGELLLHPALEAGSFRGDYVAGERENLASRIAARVNDKRQYATVRLVQLMCDNEPYGVDFLGDEAHAKAITAQALWAQYQALLRTCPIELYYCGSAPLERVGEALLGALAGLPQRGQLERPQCGMQAHATTGAPRLFEEAMEVTQGKLTLGFRTGGITVWDEAFPALLLLNAIFGGTTMSKLFLNVREKRSLCYYASAQLEKLKGVMLVSSGIEFDQYQAAKTEILAQLEACRQGQFEPWEWEGAQRSVVSSLMTTLDAQSRMEDYWLGLAAANLFQPPEVLAQRVERVTREQVQQAAAGVELDTIYFLKGKEA